LTRLRAFGADTFRSLQGANFRKFFVGQAISQTGTWMQMIAIGLLVYGITGSGFAIGLVTAAQFGPILVLGAWAGLLADRRDRHRLLLTLNVAGAVVAALFAALVLLDLAQLWSIFLLTVAAGTVTALENPARRAFVTDLVDDQDVPNAVGLNSTLMTASRVVGPAVAGALIAGPGIGWTFAVNAVSFLPQLWLFARMDRSRFREVVKVTKGKGQLVEGFRYVWATPELRLPLLLVAAVGTLAFNFAVILPVFAEQALDIGAEASPMLFSIMSVGSVAGALTMARRRSADARYLSYATLGLAASMFGLAAAPNLAVAAVMSVPVGATSVLVISGANAVIQLTAAPTMRGRVLALLAVVFLGSTPIGGPITGWVAEEFGSRTALSLGAWASLVAATWVLWVLRRVSPPPAAVQPDDALAEPSPVLDEAPIVAPAGR
jgi:MFS family permease